MKFLATLASLLMLSVCLQAKPYWQQQVNTKIDVQLDDKKHFLYGYEQLTYTNNSPDTLKVIYIHLWPNGYKNDRTAFAKQQDVLRQTDFYYAKPAARGYIDSLKFIIDGQNVDYNSTDENPDIARIDLLTPLPPGGQIELSTPFRVKIPHVFSRLGHTGQAYFISQWFPKPAVYDQFGWHPIPFLDQGEFYSNYGSYDVSITLPKNYIVMATGNCSDESEEKWLNSLAVKPLPNDTMYTHSTPASDIETKTLHYHEDNIHDFAWFADKRWIVRKDTVTSPGTNNVVTTWAAFLPASKKYWIKGTDYLRETVLHYGKWVGPYPYKTIKAVEGDMKAGGGMEYPTVTIIDRAASGKGLKSVVVHEAGHNWFYGILGTNERDHAWMDEGINSFYERKTTDALAKGIDTTDKKAIKSGNNLSDVAYYMQVAANADQAIEQTSANFTKLNYGTDVYFKTALVLKWLESYMGPADFEAGMHEYYDTWKFKHPYPEDFADIMRKHTSKSLEWFFDGLHSNSGIDFKVAHAHVHDDNTTVTVRNNGDMAPVKIAAFNADSIVATAWSAPFSDKVTLNLATTNWTKIRISRDIPDYRLNNDTYYRHGMHHLRLKVKPFGLNYSYADKLYMLPALGYNQYDGFQLGLLFHDLSLPDYHFRFAVAPMYAFNSKTMTGAGSVGYIWYPHSSSVFKDVLLQTDVKSFDYDQATLPGNQQVFTRYVKVAPALNFTFREQNSLSTVERTLTLKAYSITENNFDYGADSTVTAGTTQQQKYYGLLRYKHNNTRWYNPFNYSLEAQGGADFAKINAEANVRVDYYKKNKSLYIRGYVGKFFAINSDPNVTQRYYLNSTYTGADDYLYDDTYFGRSATNGVAAQQISMSEGGFKIPTQNNIGRSDDWLATINMKTDLPFGALPIRLFLDAGLIPNTAPDEQHPGDTRPLYDAGVEIHAPSDIIAVYIPVLMSSDFQNYLVNTYGKNNQFARSISFTLKLQNVNWLKITSSVRKLLLR
ncbi:MAG: M1 family metallopeptidase [Flavipsychrobacter sp.]|nr:M1 family metallopeptidase [Flavipsychrobacter sp.]